MNVFGLVFKIQGKIAEFGSVTGTQICGWLVPVLMGGKKCLRKGVLFGHSLVDFFGRVLSEIHWIIIASLSKINAILLPLLKCL